MTTMVTAAREQQSSARPELSPPAAGRSRRGCFGPFLFALLVLAGLGFYAVESTGSLHRAVATVVPSIRHPRLQGPLDLSGTFTAQHLLATQVPPKLQSGGTCAQAGQRTAWDFKAKLPDGSTFHLVLGLPPGTGGAGSYKRPALSVSGDAQNSVRSESWTAGATSTATLTVQAGGGGTCSSPTFRLGSLVLRRCRAI